ncbi:PRTRC system protein C [Massilia sp. YIM B04103]|uniref:PRTRC system protein C n=1 Tax=Massilia sp. YIM B04103 TaxID=2963106 RepID=UPI00210CB170|nr:PRTRC system protein C [Massilia sp. YIM B04103]
MSIEVHTITKRYRYNGVTLPAPPGLSDLEVRDLHSALYPELISADIVAGEVAGGIQEITFHRAVGTKG